MVGPCIPGFEVGRLTKIGNGLRPVLLIEIGTSQVAVGEGKARPFGVVIEIRPIHEEINKRWEGHAGVNAGDAADSKRMKLGYLPPAHDKGELIWPSKRRIRFAFGMTATPSRRRSFTPRRFPILL